MSFTGKWDRSESLKDFVIMDTFTADGKEDFVEHLGLFTERKEYRINTYVIKSVQGQSSNILPSYRTTTGMRQCTERDIPEDAEFPMIWDWVKMAHYREFRDPRTNKTYDAWGEFVSHCWVGFSST